MHAPAEAKSSTSVVWGIITIVAVYAATMCGRPDLRTPESHTDVDAAATTEVAEPNVDQESEVQQEAHAEDAQNASRVQSGHAAESHEVGTMPHMGAVLPFVSLLGAIAVFPLLKQTEHWWESNLHRFYLAVALGGITLAYYGFLFPHGGADKVSEVLDHAILREYIPFIVLLFSLYTISGGIRIDADLVATPKVNSIFLIVGGLLASFIGTTGAAMLLIRPLLDTNSERKHVQHTVVFFIFVVCNCGGCLLPIGDPPLFLGYLKGVPFLWTMKHLLIPWLVTNAFIVGIYYLLDRLVFFRRETRQDIRRDQLMTRRLVMKGLSPNVWLLIGVVLCVGLLDPSKEVPGTNWKAWPYLREVLQLVLVGVSLQFGSREIRIANRFNYHAIVEVAALFIGIFVCMQPAIEILHVRGGSLGLNTPPELFWATGSLSAVLDNAPTYVVFYETAASEFSSAPFHQLVTMDTEHAAVAIHMLQAISLGAVFMGAMTYIGNGPNFMVRAIAEQTGVRMPSFFGYVMRYSIPVLIPVFVLVTLVFLL